MRPQSLSKFISDYFRLLWIKANIFICEKKDKIFETSILLLNNMFRRQKQFT